MNLIVRMVSSRYLLYIEDDWLPLSKPLVPLAFLQPLLAGRGTPIQADSAVTLRDFLTVALRILKKQNHPTACPDFDCLEDRSIVQASLHAAPMLLLPIRRTQ